MSRSAARQSPGGRYGKAKRGRHFTTELYSYCGNGTGWDKREDGLGQLGARQDRMGRDGTEKDRVAEYRMEDDGHGEIGWPESRMGKGRAKEDGIRQDGLGEDRTAYGRKG